MSYFQHGSHIKPTALPVFTRQLAETVRMPDWITLLNSGEAIVTSACAAIAGIVRVRIRATKCRKFDYTSVQGTYMLPVDNN